MQKYIPKLFFLLFFIAGLFVVQDYGCSWDEDQQMKHGKVSAKEICKQLNLDCPKLERDKNLPALQDYEQKYYGTFFQLVAIGIDTVLVRERFGEKILTRHYLGFLLFFIGVICFYRLLFTRFEGLLSLLGVIIYATLPRIFAHSFFNPKDTIFLSFFVISLYALSRFLNSRDHKNVLFMAFSSALMLNARILGLVLFLAVIASLILYKKTIKRNLKWTLLYIGETFLCLVVIWPLLWENTFTNLLDTFTLFSKYPWEGELLYWGNYISSSEIPWHYIPSWILITTPLFFLMLMLLGIALMVFQILKNYKLWFESYTVTLDGIVLGVTLGPLIAIIIFDSVVYGGWRHLFFIHAGLVYALIFCVKFLQSKYPKLKRPLLLSLGIAIIWNVVQLVRLHPQQHLYFNPLITESLQEFEQDYWGVSTKLGMEKLMEIIPQDKSSSVFAYDFPAWCNFKILNPKAEKLEFVWEQEKGDYFIDNFRRKEHIDAFLNKTGLYSDPVYVIYSQGSPVVGIFKL